MNKVTSRNVLEILQKMTEEQLNQNLTIFDFGTDEFFPIDDVFVSGYDENNSCDGILDDGNLVFVFNKDWKNI